MIESAIFLSVVILAALADRTARKRRKAMRRVVEAHGNLFIARRAR